MLPMTSIPDGPASLILPNAEFQLYAPNAVVAVPRSVIAIFRSGSTRASSTVTLASSTVGAGALSRKVAMACVRMAGGGASKH